MPALPNCYRGGLADGQESTTTAVAYCVTRTGEHNFPANLIKLVSPPPNLDLVLPVQAMPPEFLAHKFYIGTLVAATLLLQ